MVTGAPPRSGSDALPNFDKIRNGKFRSVLKKSLNKNPERPLKARSTNGNVYPRVVISFPLGSESRTVFTSLIRVATWTSKAVSPTTVNLSASRNNLKHSSIVSPVLLCQNVCTIL
jgi:hypothetical protein